LVPWTDFLPVSLLCDNFIEIFLAMVIRTFPVDAALTPYVKEICIMEIAGTGVPGMRVLPDTCIEIFIRYISSPLAIVNGKALTKSLVTSRMNSFMDSQMEAGSGCIAVCFHPGAARHFFTTALKDFNGQAIELGELWPDAHELEEKLSAAENNEERAFILQESLVKKLRTNYCSDESVTHCLWQLNLHKGALNAQQLADGVGLSRRQLGRRFNDHIGMAPKEFARVSRFIHSLKHLKRYPALSLTEVAYESGYYDQAHFIHDYREFAGMTPGELVDCPNIVYC
jgi:AraC-like DNA-binding protein